MNNHIVDRIKEDQQCEANKVLLINSYRKEIDEPRIEILNKYKEEIQKWKKRRQMDYLG